MNLNLTVPNNSAFKSEVWALGVVYYAMIVGLMPFQDPKRGRLIYNIRQTEPSYPDFLETLDIEILKMMLLKNPRKRASISDVLLLLE